MPRKDDTTVEITTAMADRVGHEVHGVDAHAVEGERLSPALLPPRREDRPEDAVGPGPSPHPFGMIRTTALPADADRDGAQPGVDLAV